jgi:hypothetical protein
VKKFLIWVLALIAAAAIGAFIFYKLYLPRIVAEAIVKGEDELAYMPDFVQTRIRKYRAPVNEAADDVIRELHKSGITMEQITEAIDKTGESQVDGLLAELANTELKSTNQVFDIATKHLQVDFDVEPLRAPFNENVDLDMVRSAIERAQQHRKDEAVDAEMAKAIFKQILLQKEAEYQQKVKGN